MKDLLYVYLGILSDLPELWGREWKMKRSSNFLHQLGSVQSLSLVRLCNPMNHSTQGLPVHHQLLEFTQTHVHRVSDAI